MNNNNAVENSKSIILQYIIEKKINNGGKLPSIRDFQAKYFISRYSIMKALDELCDERIIIKGEATRNGYFVLNDDAIDASTTYSGRISAHLILPFDRWNYVGNQMLTHIEHKFVENNSSITVNNNANSPTTERKLLLNLLSTPENSKPDILVLMPSCSIDNPNIEILNEIKKTTPIILIDRKIYGFESSFVGICNQFVGHDAALKLLNKGRRQFAFVSGFSSITPIRERMYGFVSALDAYDVKKENQRTIISNRLDFGDYFTVRSHIEAVAETLLNSSFPPDGIFCGSDRIATCLINYFSQLNINQDKISIISCDNDIEFASRSVFAPTSYAQPFEEIAKTIFDLSIELNKTPNLMYRNIEFNPRFIKGETL